MTVIAFTPPISPGEVLKEEFLDPLGINTYRLCKDTGLSRGFWRRSVLRHG